MANIFAEINGERIELVGAAEEATMKKILEAIQSGKGTGGVGGAVGGGAGGTTAGLVKLGKSLNVVNVGFNLLGKVVGGVVKGFTALAHAGSAAVQFSTSLIDAQPTVVDLAKGIKSATGDFLGLGSALEAVVSLLQKNYNTFQQLSSSGIMFGNRMTTLTRLGTKLGVSLAQAAGELTKNSQRLAYMGTATQGAAKAVELTAEMSDKFGRTLLRYGVSFEEQSERYNELVAANALAIQKGTMSMSYLVENSDDYVKNLRRLSEISGKTADEQEEELNRMKQNKMFENFLATLPEGAKLASEELIKAASTGGPAMAEAMQAALMGVAPLTEGAQNLSSLMPGLNRTFTSLAGQAKAHSGSLEMFTNSMHSQLMGLAQTNKTFVDKNSKYFTILGMMGDQYGEAGSSMALFTNAYLNSQASAAGETDTLTNTFIELELAMKKIRDVFNETFLQILGSETVQSALKKLAEVLPIMAEDFSKFMLGITEDIKQKGFFGWLKSVWTDLMLDLRLAINDKLGIAVSDKGLKRDLEAKYSGATMEELEKARNEQTTDSGRKFLKEMIDERVKANIQQTKDILSGRRDAILKKFEDYEVGWMGIDDLIESYTNKQGQTMYKLDEDYEGKRTSEMLPIDQMLKVIDRLNTYQKFLEDESRSYYDEMTGTSYHYRYNPLRDSETLKNAQQFGGITPTYRSFGTQGMTGLTKEPADTLAYIHKDERVLDKGETARYNRMANNGVDGGQHLSVNLKESLNMIANAMREQNNLTRQVISAVENA